MWVDRPRVGDTEQLPRADRPDREECDGSGGSSLLMLGNGWPVM